MFKLEDLPYDYAALEPYIDEKTMRIHHDKHHAGYVSKLNDALKGHDDLLSKNLDDLLRDLAKIPSEIKTAVQNSGGGHANHTLFWKIMGPGKGGEPQGDLSEAINANFTSFNSFKEKFSQLALGRFGSGWSWLVTDGSNLEVVSTVNQDTPLSEGKIPILGLDVWEHAYYLKYQNRRVEYIEAWWNVVNWDKVAENFKKSTK